MSEEKVAYTFIEPPPEAKQFDEMLRNCRRAIRAAFTNASADGESGCLARSIILAEHWSDVERHIATALKSVEELEKLVYPSFIRDVSYIKTLLAATQARLDEVKTREPVDEVIHARQEVREHPSAQDVRSIEEVRDDQGIGGPDQ